MNLIKSILHNIGVLVVSFTFALIGVGLDYLFGIGRFYSPLAVAAGSVLLTAGFLLRVWATYHFYQHNMKVIVLHAQQSLITDGPYRFSRHPLYLGGNVFMFLGATFLLGTPSGVVLTIAHQELLAGLTVMCWRRWPRAAALAGVSLVVTACSSGDLERLRGRTPDQVKQACDPERNTPEECSRTLDK